MKQRFSLSGNYALAATRTQSKSSGTISRRNPLERDSTGVSLCISIGVNYLTAEERCSV